MPGLRLKEVRLPELDLPEMSRDDIMRAINDTRRDVDLSRLDPRRIELPDVDVRKVDLSKIELPRVELSRIDLSKVDLPKALLTAAQATGLVRKRRSRTPLIVGGLIVVTMVGIALISSPLVKPRLMRAAQRWRERMAAREEAIESGTDVGVAGAGESVAVPIQPTTYDIPPTSSVSMEDVPLAVAEAAAADADAATTTIEQPEGATI